GPHFPEGNNTFSGTATDTLSGVVVVKVALSREGALETEYLNDQNAFTTTPHEFDATLDDGTWSYEFPDTVLEHGETYELTAYSIDAAGNESGIVDDFEFTWNSEVDNPVFTINGGDPFTNSPTVTLTIPEDDQIEDYQLVEVA